MFAVSVTSATLSPSALSRPTLSSLPPSTRRRRRTLGTVDRTRTRAASPATPLPCRPSRLHTSTKATSRGLPSSANPTATILLTGRYTVRTPLRRSPTPRASRLERSLLLTSAASGGTRACTTRSFGSVLQVAARGYSKTHGSASPAPATAHFSYILDGSFFRWVSSYRVVDGGICSDCRICRPPTATVLLL